MAYQAKRHTKVVEEFQLCEEDGTIVRTLRVELDPDSVAAKLSAKHVALVRAMQDVQKLKGNQSEKSEELEILGQAMTDIMEAVFGAEGAAEIINFYDGRYVEMCQEVVPFITKVVLPQVRAIARDNRKKLAASYNRPRGFMAVMRR